MAKPAQIGRPENPQNIIPVIKIIESLSPAPKAPAPPDIQPLNPESATDAERLQPSPLSLEEVIPSPFEIRQILSTTAIWIGSLILVVSIWVLTLEMLSKTATRLPVSAETDTELASKISLPLPHPAAPRVRPSPGTLSVPPHPEPIQSVRAPEPARPIPGNLSARYDSPTMIELTWDFVGDGYTYQLYSSLSPTMTNVLLETDTAVRSPHFVWQPRRAARAMWVAVTSVDAQGRESKMGAPLYIHLPPEF